MSDLNKINLILINSCTQIETQRHRCRALICVQILVVSVVKLSIKNTAILDQYSSISFMKVVFNDFKLIVDSRVNPLIIIA